MLCRYRTRQFRAVYEGIRPSVPSAHFITMSMSCRVWRYSTFGAVSAPCSDHVNGILFCVCKGIRHLVPSTHFMTMSMPCRVWRYSTFGTVSAPCCDHVSAVLFCVYEGIGHSVPSANLMNYDTPETCMEVFNIWCRLSSLL